MQSQIVRRACRTESRRRALRVAAALASSAAVVPFAPGALAQPDLSQKPGPTVADTGSRFYRFETSRLVSADGRRRYRVVTGVPRRAAPAAGHPVIYLLDGNAALAAIDEQRLQALDETGSPPVIVAIGYDTDLRFDVVARAFDYTPPVAGGATVSDPVRGREGGGADVFLDLIEDRIKPQAQGLAPIDRGRQALWGHSYGGLFALHVLFTRPQAFRSYVAADPALWWNDGFILKEEHRAAPLPAGETRLWVMTGRGAPARQRPPSQSSASQSSASQSPASQSPASRPPAPPGVDAGTVARMRQARASVPPGAVRDLAARQAARAGLSARLSEFDGVAHGPMLGVSLGPALMSAAGVEAGR